MPSLRCMEQLDSKSLHVYIYIVYHEIYTYIIYVLYHEIIFFIYYDIMYYLNYL